jgi:hypothetical protein
MHLLTNILVTILCRLMPWKMLYIIGKKLLRTNESMDNFVGRNQPAKTVPKAKSK